jgi:hypothetical protein
VTAPSRVRSRALPVLVAAPALAVAAAGLAHPVLLTPDTAERWRAVHLVLLPLFPLVGASVWVLLLRRRGAVAWAARGLAAAFGLLYTALDSIAGIGGGHQVLRAAGRGDPRPPVEDLYEVGDRLGHAGVVALALALLLTAVLLWRETGSPLALLGGVVGAVSCWPFYEHHVFAPRGVLALVGVGAGLALLGAARLHRRPRGTAG